MGRTRFYDILLYLAYIFYIGFGIFWFYIDFASSRHINYSALGILLVFGIQLFFRRRLVNLVLGILTLFLSIWMSMEVVSTYNLFAKGSTLDNGGKVLLSLCVTSIVMSVILMFSYQTLNKENMNKGK
jgi:hypothetical protein